LAVDPYIQFFMFGADILSVDLAESLG